MTETSQRILKFVSAQLDIDPATGERKYVEIDVNTEEATEVLKPVLDFQNKLIDAENLVVLAGSGTSLTLNGEGHDKLAPSMWDLWEACKQLDNDRFDAVLQAVNYEDVAEKNADDSAREDIELLLSLCDSYLGLKCLDVGDHSQIESFLADAKAAILDATDFTDRVTDELWGTHNTFVRTLARRSPKQKRLKLFTTNYDLAFEVAASNTGMLVIDGFEFSTPSRFNPSWFDYDIVNRVQATEKGGAYLPNVFHLHKIHGSVDWVKTDRGLQKRSISSSSDGEPVFIYPSSSKYQNSYESPYLDMMSAFLSALQRPKTALLCVGFGFNDMHINNAISMALRTNHELMVMAATRSALKENSSFNQKMKDTFLQLINAGDSRVAIADCSFDVFSKLLPNRHKSTPEEELLRVLKSGQLGSSS